MQAIIQTRADLDAAYATTKAKFLQWLKGAAVNRVNVAEYPEDYDEMEHQPGDPGYIAPDWQDQENKAVLQRYGFGSISELESEAGNLRQELAGL